MDKFLKRLELNDDVDCSEGAEARDLLLCNRRLKEAGFPEIPEKWQMLLNISDGLFYDGAEVFSVNAKDEMFRRLENVNQDIVWEKLENVLLLGENDVDFLVFDGREFLIVDKDSEDIRHHTPDAALAAGYLTGI